MIPQRTLDNLKVKSSRNQYQNLIVKLYIVILEKKNQNSYQEFLLSKTLSCKISISFK